MNIQVNAFQNVQVTEVFLQATDAYDHVLPYVVQVFGRCSAGSCGGSRGRGDSGFGGRGRGHSGGGFGGRGRSHSGGFGRGNGGIIGGCHYMPPFFTTGMPIEAS